MPSFEIPDGPASVPLKAGTANGQPTRTGSVTYSVTNKGASGLAGRLSVLVAGDAKAEWFQVEGEKERPFAPGETQTVTFNVNIPTTVKAGVYKFRPRVVAVNDPDNDHTDGPVATLQVAGAAKPPATGAKKFPMWIVFASIAAVVVIGGGVLTFMLWPKGGNTVIPDLKGKTAAVAQAELKALDPDLVIKTNLVPNAAVPVGTVFDQTPKATEPLASGAEVILSVAAAPEVPAEELFAVPDTTNRSLENAKGLLEASGFLTTQRVEGPPAGQVPETVTSQDPIGGTPTAKSASIILTVDPGVSVPRFEGGSLQGAVNAAANKVSLTVSERCEQGPLNVVISQSVDRGRIVAKNTQVDVKVRRNPNPTCRSLKDRVLSSSFLASEALGAATRFRPNP